jgi:beta-glucosidase
MARRINLGPGSSSTQSEGAAQRSDWERAGHAPVSEEGNGFSTRFAEYGIGTADDSEREDYLERGLEITYQALQKGIDIRGFLHWTAVANYEWLHGFDVQFGLIDSARRPKKSISILAREACKTVSSHTQ